MAVFPRSAFDVHMAQRSSELVSKVSLKVQDDTTRTGTLLKLLTSPVSPAGSTFAEATEAYMEKFLSMSSRREPSMRLARYSQACSTCDQMALFCGFACYFTQNAEPRKLASWSLREFTKHGSFACGEILGQSRGSCLGRPHLKTLVKPPNLI